MVYGTHEKEIFGYFEENVTNQRMELYAVVQALKTLKRSCNVRIISDSEYVVEGIKTRLGQWVKKGWRTNAGNEPAHRDLWEEVLALQKMHNIEAVWERGHNGHAGNERADRLARTARTNRHASSPAA